ncbi:MAG: sigma-70 family RNA polymerase sigma factor [Pirellulales bacterium]|nr:sigma-70 family RNA polymerase sigma factor [Pirellulales bacterium]
MSDVPTDDAQLVAAARRGDREAFGALVERYQDRVYNTLLRVLGSRDDALDVVQDALVQAYVKLDSFRGDARFYTWLYRIAMNLALSHRRRRRPSVSVEEMKQRVGDEPMSNQPPPESGCMEQERAAIVERALGELGDEHCQILVLREMESCSYEEISEILELPIGTVRSRLFRARIQLKEKLKELMPDEVVND